MPKDTTESRHGPPLRRDFRFPPQDEDYLNSLGLPWETALDGQSRWLIIHDWQIPAGYCRQNTSLALLIPANYSDSQIDMVYFNDHPAPSAATSINSLSAQSTAGDQWQGSATHRPNANPSR